MKGQEQLGKVIKTLNQLKSILADKKHNPTEVREAREAVESAMSPLADMYDLLRRFMRPNCSMCSEQCMDNIKHAVASYGRGYPYLWDSLAKPEFISELERLAKGKEQRWDKNDRDYMAITEAVEDAKKKGRRLSVPTLSRKLTPDGQMRYMVKYAKSRKPSRRKVHIGDFRTFVKTLPLIDDPFSEEAFERRKVETRKEKEAKGEHRGKREGLVRLLKDTIAQ